MVRHEVKVGFAETEKLQQFIEDSYFRDGQQGRINGKKNSLLVEKEDSNYKLLSELDGSVIKIWNSDIIDGTMRFMVSSKKGVVKINAISIYAILEEGKYIFY